jgi:hypothetical protein
MLTVSLLSGTFPPQVVYSPCSVCWMCTASKFQAGGGVEWIQLAQDGDRFRALVNTVIDVWDLAPRS